MTDEFILIENPEDKDILVEQIEDTIIIEEQNEITEVIVEENIGPAGDAATITIGTVTNLEPGATATVSNSGTVQNAIFDFGIPVGAKIIIGTAAPTGAVGVNGDIYIRSSLASYPFYQKVLGTWILS